jgi:cyclohexadienyl dehydratase
VRIFKATLRTYLSCVCFSIFSAYGAQFADSTSNADQLASLVQQRLELMKDVARWKYTHSLPVRDPAREAVVLSDVQRQAGELGMESSSVRDFFQIQMDAASELEEKDIQRFKAGEPVGDVKDLARELRPRLDVIGTQLIATLYQLASDLPQSSKLSLAAKFERAGLSTADSVELERVVERVRFEHAPSFAAIKQSGVLRIATTGDYAPFSAVSGDALVGSDVESAEKFAASLGLKAHFIHTTWSTLMTDFAHNTFDVAVGGVSVTPERSAAAKFTNAYHHGGKTPIVRCGSEKAFDTLEEIDQPNVRVIVNPGGTNERFAKDHFQHAHVIVFPDNTKIFQEISAGRADVMVTDDAEVDLQVSLNPTLCRATPQTFTQSDKAWMLTNNPELLDAANAWLTAHGTH